MESFSLFIFFGVFGCFITPNGFVYDLWRLRAAESAEAKRGAFARSSSQSCVRFSELGAAFYVFFRNLI